MQKIQKNHKPPHYFADNQIYLITASTYNKKPLFDNDQKKIILYTVLWEKAAKFEVEIFAFVIMDSHYHILIKIKDCQKLSAFVKEINGKSALSLNKIDNAPGREVWYNYWDSCIKEENDFWARFNYIHHNPVKHSYVERMEDYQFCSYKRWVEEKGIKWMEDVIENYPIVDFTKGDK